MSIIHTALAQTYQLEGPGIAPGSSPETTMERIISVIIGVLSAVAFIYFAIQIIFAGYEFMSAQGDPKRIEGAKNRLTMGVLGIVIVVVAVTLANLLGRLAGIESILDLSGFFTSVGL